jgi:hypothetical protein
VLLLLVAPGVSVELHLDGPPGQPPLGVAVQQLLLPDGGWSPGPGDVEPLPQRAPDAVVAALRLSVDDIAPWKLRPIERPISPEHTSESLRRTVGS